MPTSKFLVRCIQLLVVAAAVVPLTSCVQNVAASVGCSDVSKLESELGFLNLPKLGMGALLWFDSANKTVTRIYTVPITNDQLTPPTPVIDTTSLITSGDFSVDVSGNVPSTVQAEIKSYVNSNTQYDLAKSTRTDIRDPISALNGSQAAKDAAARVPSGDVLVFVSGVVNGTSIGISLKGQSGVSATANVIKFGNFSVTISYDCSNSVQQQSTSGAPLLWKQAEVAYDQNSKSFGFSNKPLKMTDYNFTSTFQ